MPGRAVDLAIAGGGVIGLAAAFEARRRGLSVAVVDAGCTGSGASAVAAGMVALAFEAEDAPPALLDLARTSVALYPDFARAVEAASGHPVDFRTEGTLWLALDRDDAAQLRHLHDIQRRFGIAAEPLSRDAAREREPLLSSRTVSALYSADDRLIDPRALCRAMVTALRAGGALVVENAHALRVDSGAQAARGLVWDGGAVAAAHVLLAAGCATNDLLPLGVAPLPLRPVKGQTVRLRGPVAIDHVIRTPRVYMAPRRDGEIVIGATMEERSDSAATVLAVHELLTEARRAVPALDELAISELPVGFRPALRDHLPAIGPLGPRNLLVATGHFRNGVMLAPATARLLLDLVEGRATSGPFDPLRFQEQDNERTGERRIART